ncbi:MAG: Gfo/Idh/MocA family oxidoreductase [Planctomycetota bacterium]|jgi:predicted dehydrogenase
MKQTRRDFLKASSAIFSGAAASNMAISWNAYAGGNDTIRVGMIGCGGRGGGAAVQAMKADPGVRVVAMADLFEDRLQAKRKVLKEMKPRQMSVDDDHCFIGFDGYKQLINSGVDVVLIANASRFHARHLKACVEAGKHSFVEKPAAIDPPDVKVVLASAEQAQKANPR